MNDLQRAVAALRDTFLKVIFDVAHLVGDMGEAHDGLGSGFGKSVERRRFHFDA